MRIHSDSITPDMIYQALRNVPGQRDGYDMLHIEQCDEYGSRKRARAFEVKLATLYGGKGTRHPYRPNSGKHGAGGYGEVWAASYDDWGWFLAELFEHDPDMIAGQYKGRDDFNRQTDDRYAIPMSASWLRS